MALESSFFPFPSEVVIPPAAYLAASGKMNIGMVVLCGTVGSLLGAVFNYWLGHHYREELRRMWPFARYPGMLKTGEAFSTAMAVKVLCLVVLPVRYVR